MSNDELKKQIEEERRRRIQEEQERKRQEEQARRDRALQESQRERFRKDGGPTDERPDKDD